MNAMSIVRKQVRPVAEQEEFESRRMWRECTLGLKYVKCAVVVNDFKAAV